MTFFIETKNLILREIRISDEEGIYRLDSNEQVHKYLGKNPISTREEAKNIISFIFIVEVCVRFL